LRPATPPLRQDLFGHVIAGFGINNQKRHLPVPPDPQFVETAIAPDFPILEPPVRVKLDEDRQWFEIAHLGLLSRPDFITSRARLQPALRWSGRDELLSALELQ